MNVQPEHADEVVDEASFVRFLRLLAQDRDQVQEKERLSPSSPYGPNAHCWVNGTLETFLRAAYACWDDSIKAHGSIGVQSSNPWTRAAHILLRGKSYE
jgi:hypothetical protein